MSLRHLGLAVLIAVPEVLVGWAVAPWLGFVVYAVWAIWLILEIEHEAWG